MPDYYRPMRTTRRPQNYTSVLPKWYKVTNQAAGGPTQIVIYDEIGMLGCSVQDFTSELAAIKGDIDLHISSPGGDVFDGITIYNRLRAHDGTVSVVVDGLAASAASFIAMAASPGKLGMAPHSQLMIHDGFSMVIGNAADLRKTADLLDEVSNNIAGIYADRTGKPVSYFRDLMKNEKWFSDQEAVDTGLADYIVGKEPVVNDWDLSVYNSQRPEVQDDGGNNGWMQRDGKWVYDPMNDGDDDYQAETDTDHDYWSADGTQLKEIPAGPEGSGKAAKPLTTHSNSTSVDISNAKYNTDDRKRMASNGEAMADGSYPIADAEDLGKAIDAVGRGTGSHNAIRQHIIKRAKALGLSERIPDNWNSDGSLQSSETPGNSINTQSLAALFTSMALEGGV